MGQNFQQWIHLIIVLLIVGSSVIGVIARKLKEYKLQKQHQENLRKIELERLRTGRDVIPTSSGPVREELQSRVPARESEFARRRRAMQEEEARRGGSLAGAGVRGPGNTGSAGVPGTPGSQPGMTRIDLGSGLVLEVPTSALPQSQQPRGGSPAGTQSRRSPPLSPPPSPARVAGRTQPPTSVPPRDFGEVDASPRPSPARPQPKQTKPQQGKTNNAKQQQRKRPEGSRLDSIQPIENGPGSVAASIAARNELAAAAQARATASSPSKARSERARALFPTGLSAEELRRAFILNEVLGPPVAERSRNDNPV
ncbi:MAG: hypothetical protein SFZ23_16195 [Planctomycetota bacterium]|nr:hypothetical protein [Planctomycetota bacterium]